MRLRRARVRRDERGASLVLAITFMMVAGAVGAGLTTSVASGVRDSTVLSQSRNRQYAAEGAIDAAIATVRATDPATIGLETCGGPYVRTLNQNKIRVQCTPAPTLTPDGFLRHNVIFTACVDKAQPCDDNPGSETSTIERAQVNFQVSVSGAVTRTYVQTWSVNG